MQNIISLMMGLLIISACNAPEQPVKTDSANTRQEVSELLDKYARLVKESKFDSLYTLYEKDGAIMAGIGFLDKQPLDSIKKEYASFDFKTTGFEWINPDIQVLSPDVALITSKFNWLSNLINDTARSTYSSIVRKKNNEWLIMYEHETWDYPTAKKLIATSESQKSDSTIQH